MTPRDRHAPLTPLIRQSSPTRLPEVCAISQPRDATATIHAAVSGISDRSSTSDPVREAWRTRRPVPCNVTPLIQHP